MARHTDYTLRQTARELNLTDNLPFELGGSGLPGETVDPRAISKVMYWLNHGLRSIRIFMPTDPDAGDAITRALPKRIHMSWTDGLPVEDVTTEITKQLNVRRKYDKRYWGKVPKEVITDQSMRRQSTNRGTWYLRTANLFSAIGRSATTTDKSRFLYSSVLDIKSSIRSDLTAGRNLLTSRAHRILPTVSTLKKPRQFRRFVSALLSCKRVERIRWREAVKLLDHYALPMTRQNGIAEISLLKQRIPSKYLST